MASRRRADALVGRRAPTYVGRMGLSAGMQFRGLLVHSKLGEGGMGEAYLVSHPVLQTPFVVKIYQRGAGDELLSEAHLAARITSPHVVRVHDAGVATDIDRAFIVQRFVDGIDLDELVSTSVELGRRLPLGVVMRLVADAARGLHAIHQAGVIHRDIKPSNLFMSGEGTASIGDFGIAIARDGTETKPTSAGTPQYMAPEQWRDEPVDRRADLYALGATAHHLATGAPPFHGDTLDELAMAHVHDPYAPPRAESPTEAYLFAVIERLLRKSPAKRYATAEQVATDLARLSSATPRFTGVADDVALVGALRVRLLRGDIARVANDVIVNAANCELEMNIGVAKALRGEGGEAIEREAQAQADRVPMGTVVWTSAGRLSARWVAHAVSAMEGAVCLQRSCLRVLLGAEQRRAISVAFPALGTGVGNVPMALAAKLMLESFVTFASLEPDHVRSINVLLHDAPALDTWRAVLEAM